ncbi:hypothetical protein [Streptomyces sp. HUAS TT3]|uniref:hypothetical protein n=1 Tax=Streptomyces sp. HUAS TT3 TaxID=3447510 RepID=UPI003F659690
MTSWSPVSSGGRSRGLLTGTLTWRAGSPVAGAVLAGLAGAGSSVPAPRSLIGRLP